MAATLEELEDQIYTLNLKIAALTEYVTKHSGDKDSPPSYESVKLALDEIQEIEDKMRRQ